MNQVNRYTKPCRRCGQEIPADMEDSLHACPPKTTGGCCQERRQRTFCDLGDHKNCTLDTFPECPCSCHAKGETFDLSSENITTIRVGGTNPPTPSSEESWKDDVDNCQQELFKANSNYKGDFNGRLNLQYKILEKHFRQTLLKDRERLAAQILESTKWADGKAEGETPEWKAHYEGYREARKDILALLSQGE